MTLREKIEFAFPRSIPVMCGYLFLGTAFGIVLAEAGFSVIWALFMSVIVFAGSMQFVMVPLMAAGVSPLTMAVTALFVNSRHIFYGLTFVESFRKLKGRIYMMFALSDETYSILCGIRTEDPEEKTAPAWIVLQALNQSYWVIGSVFGAFLGKMLPVDFTGIDFSMTALFAVILLEQILGNKRIAGLSALSGSVSAIACLFIFGSDKFLLPSLLITVFWVFVIQTFSAKAGKEESHE